MFRRLTTPILLPSLAIATTLVFSPWPGLVAQVTTEELPKIEGTYTQVFSADSVSIRMAALSPDGRWIVFTRAEGSENMGLWMVSAQGGEPIRLTTGRNLDHGPVWFPDGDRIAYRSGDHIVGLPVDPATGHPTGLQQRLTVDLIVAYFDISPDGKWITYIARGEGGNAEIRVAPSNGGVARTVANEGTSRPAWAPDGRSVYYITERLDSPEEVVLKVPVVQGVRPEGVLPDTVLTSWGNARLLTYPNTAFLLLEEADETEGNRVTLASLGGRRLGWMELGQGMEPIALSKDSRTMLAIREDYGTPLRVLPLSGGPPRTLHRDDSTPVGWIQDADRVLLETTLDGERIFLMAGITGGTMTQLPIPEDPEELRIAGAGFPEGNWPEPVLSADGRYLLYAIPGITPDTAVLKILDRETGRASVLTSRSPTAGWSRSGRVVGPGGTVNRDEDEFFYWEKEGGALALRAATPQGESRSLGIFSDAMETATVSVFQDRLAFVRHSDGKAFLMLGEVGGGEARHVFTVDGFLDMVVWSPDGEWLAATNWPLDGSGSKVMMARVSESGEVLDGPRFQDPGMAASGMAAWWGHQWLPDSRGMLAVSTDGEVWLFSVDPTVEPVSLTEEEEGSVFGFLLSPDGDHIVYPSLIQRGSSLWLIDLGDALVGQGGG